MRFTQESVDSDPAKWEVTQGMLEREIGKVRKRHTRPLMMPLASSRR